MFRLWEGTMKTTTEKYFTQRELDEQVKLEIKKKTQAGLHLLQLMVVINLLITFLLVGFAIAYFYFYQKTFWV